MYRAVHRGGKVWEAEYNRSVESRPIPVTNIRIIQIEFTGCSLGDINVSVDVPQGCFVVFRPNITVNSLPKGVDPAEIMSRTIYYNIEGINNAAFVFSTCNTYPSNLDREIPTLEDVRNPKLYETLPALDSFLEYLGVTREDIKNAARTTEYATW